MNKSIFSTRTIVAIGIGTALFVILGRFAAIPTGIPNTSIHTNYAFLALIASIFGPLAGLFIGFIGHTLQDVISYGSVWWSWVFASAVVGLGIGLFFKQFNVQDGHFGTRKIVIFNIVQALSNAVAWFLIAPTLDILIYAEPANKVYTQGVFSGLSNIVTVGVLGTFLLIAYAKTRTPKGSLSYEE